MLALFKKDRHESQCVSLSRTVYKVESDDIVCVLVNKGGRFFTFTAQKRSNFDENVNSDFNCRFRVLLC